MGEASATTQWWTRRAFMHTPERMAQIAVEARRQHGWTVQQLADEAGVPADLVETIESGRPAPANLDQVYRVFRALHVKILALPSSLVGGAA